MDKAQVWAMDIEEIYNKAEIHSINTSKGDSRMLEYSPIILLYKKHLSEGIKTHLIEIYDNYCMLKNWLICNYGGPSRIVGDIVSSLMDKRKPGVNNRKEKFVYFSAIIGA